MSRKWIEALHPRDMRGRFARRGGGPAARAQRREGNRVAPGMRGKRTRGYARAGLNVVGGVAGGAFSAEIGRRSGSRTHTAAGLGRVGLAVAEGRYNVRSTRRTTSKAFAALNADEQDVELARMRSTGRRYRAASAAGDIGLSVANQRTIERNIANRARDEQWRVQKRNAANAGDRYGKFQGPGSHRAKRPNRRGIYDVTSSPVRKPRKPRKARRSGGASWASVYKRRTGRSAAARARAAERFRRNRGRKIPRSRRLR